MTKRKSFILAKKELSNFFSGPIAYIIISLFLIIIGVLFFSYFFLDARAEMRGFFSYIPILFSFFIPALTMRLFSEEKKSGTFETILTIPIKPHEIVIGKYLSAVLFICIMIAPTFLYLITLFLTGSPDIGPLIGGYLGSILLGASFASIGLFISSITKNQIIAFFGSWAICFSLFALSQLVYIFPAFAVGFIENMTVNYHFENLSRGIIDSRNILYFFSIIAIFLLATVNSVKERR